MLLEMSKVEQQHEAVVAIIRDGVKVTEVAEKFVGWCTCRRARGEAFTQRQTLRDKRQQF